MAAAVVGADKKGGKRRLAPAVMLGLLGASLLVACAPVGTQTTEPGVTIVQPEQTGTEVQGVVIVPTEEPTRQPEVVEVVATEVPTETPTQEPTATPAPTETPEPTQVPGIETEMYGFLPQIMEPLTMEEVRRELENPKYDNTWPLPKFDPTYGAYELRGLLTNHRYAEIDLGEGYIVHLLADLFYRDSSGEIQKILVPLLIQNQEISRSFMTVRSQAAGSVLLRGIELRDIVDNQYQLGGRGSRANARVIFDRGYYKGDSLREYLNGYTVIAPYDFLSPINDLLGVDREEIIAFMRTGDSDVLGTVDGKPILLPSVIWSEELE